MSKIRNYSVNEMLSSNKKLNIATLDVGTTHVRCFIMNEKCQIKGLAVETVDLVSPQPGYFEIEPEALWKKIINTLNGAVKDAGLQPRDVSGLALSTQRCTFLTWNHRTQKYFHNFITWKDLRADALVNEWNSGCTLKSINLCSYGLYLLTRSKRFLAGSVLKMMNGQVTLRLVHEMQNNAQLQQAMKKREARIEFLDSWILYKLRSGNGILPDIEHITDITSCTATGLFDPFTLGWSPMIKFVFGIEVSLLPKIVDNAYEKFGNVHPSALGSEWEKAKVQIFSSMSDQSAAIWGSHCFNEGDVKITIGTGAFLNLITGKNCYASVMGMYPLVAWHFDKSAIRNSKSNARQEIQFCMEGAAHDMGTIISWAKDCGLFTDIMETASIAASVNNTNGVYFIPAFSGLGPPINDHRAGSGFIGITPSTNRSHLVRAILESIVFRLVQLCETSKQETNYKMELLRVDGGVSRNDFICQFLADASGIKVERAKNSESSVMGATYIAGLNCGLWKDVNEIRKFRFIDQVFIPKTEHFESIRERMNTWIKAIDRFCNWY